MTYLIRTNSENKDFQQLVKYLDEELAVRDGADHAFYDQFNKIDNIKHVIVAYHEGIPIACGAIKPYSEDVMEIKRMFVKAEYRGLGVALHLLRDLENWAAQLFYTSCILETGKMQPEAISLYQKAGYEVIPNYGQYEGIENSICMQRTVK